MTSNTANKNYKLEYENSNLRQEIQRRDKKERIYQFWITGISFLGALSAIAFIVSVVVR
ncbi:hypothetical protein Pryu01_03021 [Paraliobacillus ryukyuensis]|uniref:Uncharacterized protein n=1 Tax=Paraliobacillus ryukyuensis TaxID=200904 RepID=A0A366DPM9_9BACI|nr:hypothetical protein [Paraliobacillus ryukyuensis]RBO92047.1 hypothetical protein DES48_11711 [Paraliobacillus ryukyuensis]